MKARNTIDEGADAVTERQRACIAAWLATYPQPDVLDMQFDAAPVAPGKMPRHIPAAFGI